MTITAPVSPYWSVGRAGLDVAWYAPTTFDLDGDQAKAVGRFIGDTLADALWLRGQILGLADNPDEDAVPVIYPADESVTGYWRVTKAAVPMWSRSLANNGFAYELDMVRVTSSAAPLIEDRVIAALRAQPNGDANAPAISTDEPWLSLGVGAAEQTGLLGGGAPLLDRVGEDGTESVYQQAALDDVTARWYVDPEDYYRGGAVITSQAGRAFRDTFTRANGTLATAPLADTGQTWVTALGGQSPTVAPTIDTGKLKAASQGACYSIIDLGDTPAEVSCRATFSNATSGTSAIGLILGRSGGDIHALLQNCVHVAVGPGTYAFGYFSGGAFTSVATGSLTALVKDGSTESTITLAFDGDQTFTLTATGSAPVTVTDATLGSLAGRYGLWEIYWPDNTKSEPRFTEASAEPVRRAVVGRQITAEPSLWELSNGLVRTSGSVAASGASAVAEFVTANHDGTRWESAKTWRLTGTAGAGLQATIAGVRVLRSGPECSAVRVRWVSAGGSPFSIDFLLRRGARHVECLLSAGFSTTFGVVLAAPNAGTDHTSGIHASAVDGDGNYWILSSPQGCDTDNTNGGLSLQPGGQQFAFMVGAQMGTSPPTGDGFTDIVYQYFSAGAESQRTTIP